MLLRRQSDVDGAVAAAAAAFEEWSQSSLSRRTKMLFAFRELVNSRRRASWPRSSPTSTARCSPTRAARCSAASRWSSSPAASRTCSRASTPTRSPPASTPSPSASRSGVVAGITPFNFPAMVPMWMFPVAIACGNTFVLKPSERDPSASRADRPSCGSEAGPARRRVQRRARRQGGGRRAARLTRRRRGLVRRLHPDRAVHPRARHGARQAGAGPRRREEPRRSCCPTPTSTSPPTTSSPRRSARPGERCMAISAAIAVGEAGDELVDGRRPAKARAVQVGPGRDAGSEMGPVVTGRRPRPDRRADRHRARSRAPTLAVDGRGLVVAGHEDGFFVGPTVIDRVSRRWTSTARRSSARCCRCVRVDTVDDAIDLINANPYGNGTAIFTSLRRGGPAVPARRHGRHDRHQRADPGADGLLLLRRLEGLAVRRPARARAGGRARSTPARRSSRRAGRTSSAQRCVLPLPDGELN